ncbi:unnamed protein product [Closterium sp. NIES-53]
MTTLSLLASTGLTPSLLCPPPKPSQIQLLPDSHLPAPPYTELTDSLTERREQASHPALLVRAVCRAHRVRPPPVPGTHTMPLRPSSDPQHVALSSPPTSSLLDVSDLKSDLARAASPTVTHCLATLDTDPTFESAAVSALITKLVNFVSACPLDILRESCY